MREREITMHRESLRQHRAQVSLPAPPPPFFCCTLISFQAQHPPAAMLLLVLSLLLFICNKSTELFRRLAHACCPRPPSCKERETTAPNFNKLIYLARPASIRRNHIVYVSCGSHQNYLSPISLPLLAIRPGPDPFSRLCRRCRC